MSLDRFTLYIYIRTYIHILYWRSPAFSHVYTLFAVARGALTGGGDGVVVGGSVEEDLGLFPLSWSRWPSPFQEVKTKKNSIVNALHCQ